MIQFITPEQMHKFQNFGAFLFVVVMGGAILFLLYHILKRKNKVEQVQAELIRPMNSRSKTVYGLDPTKRKTLQPGNRNIVPKGWEEVHVVSGKIESIIPKGPMKYRFFGSALMVKGQPIVSSLTKTMHNVEVTETELMIDNIKHRVHQDSIKELRKLIYEVSKN